VSYVGLPPDTPQESVAPPSPSPVAQTPTPEPSATVKPTETPAPGPEIVSITISAAGDCTIGGEPRYGLIAQFLSESKNDDYSYYLRGVRHIFEADDLTIVNLEGVFTDSNSYAEKPYVFKGAPELVEVLTCSSVEVVTIANNHTMDFFQRGYDDTIATLDEAGVRYFGDEHLTIIDVKGIKVGLFGYLLWSNDQTIRDKISSAIQSLRDDGADIVIAYYHWGIELAHYPSQYQRDIARHTIDSGADLVLGSHPHVLQGIEQYNGKNIVYSLGNFCFGGHYDPKDKDSMIFQQTFEFTDGVLSWSGSNIIPCSISSVKTRNDFQPTVLTGDEAERVLERIAELSARF